MAGRKEYELLLKLKAALGGNFGSTFQTAMNTTKELQNSLQSLKKVQKDISSYKKEQDAISTGKSKVQELTAEHDKLKQRLADSAKNVKELEKALEKSAKATGRETEEYKDLQTELKKAKEDKERFADQTSKTAAAVDRAKGKVAEQEQKLDELTKTLQAAGINTANLTQENEKLSAAYDRVQKSQENIAKVNQAIDKNKAAISATKSELTKTAGTVAAVAAAFAAPIKGAMSFESSMAEVAKVVDWIGNGSDATAEQVKNYNELSDGLYKLTRQIPMTAKEFAEITAAAGQSNVAMSNSGLLDFASDAAKMGIAFDSTAEQAGEWMAKWRTSFTLTQDEVVTLADKINYLGNKSAANTQQISEIVTKIGPLGEVAGLANGEIAALGATLVAVGVQEDVAATGIKKVMTTMTAGSAATKRQKAVLDQLGVSATGLAQRMQTDAQGAILDFMGALGKLPEAEQAAALKNYFGEESVAAIAPLLTQLDLLQTHFGMVGDASQYAGSMEAEYAARAATSENSFELMKNALKELSDTFGKIFVPGAENGMQALTQLIYKVTDFVKENPELIKTVTKVAAGLAGLKIAGLGAKLGFLEIKGGILDAQKVLALFKGKTAESAAAAVTGGGKLTSLGKSISGYFGGIKTALGGMGGFASKALAPIQAIGGKVGGILSPIGANITGVFGKIGGSIANGPLGKVGGLLSSGLGKVGGVFKSLGGVSNALLQPLGGLGGAFGGLFGKVLPIIAIVSLLATLFVKLNGGDISGFIEPLQTAFEAVKPTLTALMEQLKGLGEKLMPMLLDAANQLAPLFFQIAAAILPVLASVLQAIVPIIATVAETILPVLIGVLTTLMPPLTNLITSILPVIKVLIDALIPVITILASVFGSVLGGAINAIMPIIQNIIGIFQGLIDFITGVFTGNWTQAWEGIKGIFGGIFGGLTELVKAPFRAIVSVINGVIGGLNKLKVPDWVPGIGGSGINIPLIPTFEKGSNYTPDTFIAGDVGGKGGELVTGARGRKVFTAAQTDAIFANINRMRAFNAATNAPQTPQPIPTRGGGQGGFVIQYSPTIYVDGNKPGDLEEKLKQNNETLLQMFKEFLRRERENERRMAYA